MARHARRRPPQLGTTSVAWFLKGKAEKGHFHVSSSAAKSTDPLVIRQAGLIQTLQPLETSRLKRALERYELQVRRLPKGADISHLRNPRDSRREQRRNERREARASRSRSRSSSPSGRAARAHTAGGGESSQDANRHAALAAVQEQTLEPGEIAAAEAAADMDLAVAAAEPLPEDDVQMLPVDMALGDLR